MVTGSTVTSLPRRLFTAEVHVAGMPRLMYVGAGGQRYIAAEPGAPFTIVVCNLASSRIELVASVDQRHVLDDEPAIPEAVRGVVIEPRSQYEFPGWQTRTGPAGTARRFTFTTGLPVAELAAGPAARTGVIGLAAYREAAPVWAGGREDRLADAGAGTFGGPGGLAQRRLGVGTGQEVPSPLGTTSFQRDGLPDLVSVGYATEEDLMASGVIAAGPPVPPAFPGSQLTGYAAFSGE